MCVNSIGIGIETEIVAYGLFPELVAVRELDQAKISEDFVWEAVRKDSGRDKQIESGVKNCKTVVALGLVAPDGVCFMTTHKPNLSFMPPPHSLTSSDPYHAAFGRVRRVVKVLLCLNSLPVEERHDARTLYGMRRALITK